jgi:hypothetical protein
MVMTGFLQRAILAHRDRHLERRRPNPCRVRRTEDFVAARRCRAALAVLLNGHVRGDFLDALATGTGQDDPFATAPAS